MATILDKELVRETKVMIEGREVVITLTENQTINLKLKGFKSGDVSITIEELYRQLTGKGKPAVQQPVQTEVKEKKPKGKLVDLDDIRHSMAVSDLDYASKVKIDAIITAAAKELKKAAE